MQVFDDKIPPFKLAIVQYGIIALFLSLALGLWRLQVSGNQYYERLAEQNRIRDVPILAARGKILDREGRVIVDNYPSFSALLLRDQQRDLMADSGQIAAILHMDPQEVRDRIMHFAKVAPYRPIILKDEITEEELQLIESRRNELPELDIIVSQRRLYPRNGFMAHVIGYVGEVSEEMLNDPKWAIYNPGDIVGRSGVELQYNDLLMGRNGYRRSIVDSRGKEVGNLGETPAVAGQSLRLTIDLDVQIAAEEALEGKNGAIVAIDPRSGEILAMVSRPTFDPNMFAGSISHADWNSLVNNDAHPLMNKAIQAQVAPGSTFKIIMSVAGLQEGLAQDLRVGCAGGGSYYGHFFKCHSRHGMVDLAKGIYQSCDTFFYTLAERLGISRVAKWATMLGLGQRTHVDLPQEAAGVMPSEEWKIRNFRQKWYAGETISVGIGQGAVAATPIQMATAIGGIASGGVLHRPHVALQNGLPDTLKQHNDEFPLTRQIPFEQRNWIRITDAMAQVVEPGGTAAGAHIEGVDFAGKTGTAQTISHAGQARAAKHFRANAWFVGVMPRRNPEIVVAVLYEGGEEGPYAARLAAQVVRGYVDKQRKRRIWLAQQHNQTAGAAR